MLSMLFILILIYVFFRWCLLPTIEVLLRIVDPDPDPMLRAEMREIQSWIERTDQRWLNAMNCIRAHYKLHRID